MMKKILSTILIIGIFFGQLDYVNAAEIGESRPWKLELEDNDVSYTDEEETSDSDEQN